MNKTILSTSNLSIGYLTKKEIIVIAENININLHQGKLIALVGANGIGKSTLLRTITGIQKPLSGSVLLNEREIQKFNSNELAQNLSVVLTEKIPPSNLSVYELIALGRQPYTNWIGKLSQEDNHKIKEAIHLTEIENLIEKKYFEISDGQLQKALIARALAQDTPLIILDEPTTHLDLANKISVIKLLKKLTVEIKKTILFSTHDIDLAIQIADEIVVFTENKLIQDEPCKLIEMKVFDTIFKNENIKFDSTFGKFIIK
jgi:iron complex transport system ATP-binding protein